MVRKLALFATCLISILLISSCGVNNRINDQTGGSSGNSDASTIKITAPNNGVSFSTRQSDSITISGICEKGVDLDLVTAPSRPVRNNCAMDGTWSFETGALSSGANTFSISASNFCELYPTLCSGGNLNNNGAGGGDSITIIADLAYYMTVTADKSAINIGEAANLQVRFFDYYGAEIVIPEATSPHSLAWSSDETYAVLSALNPTAPGEKNIVTGASGCLNSGGCVADITVSLTIDSAYGFPGLLTASVPITVTNTSSSPSAPIPGVATSMKIIADKTTIDCTAETGGICIAKDIANLHVAFYDAFGAELVIPEATTDHSISWITGDPTIATVLANASPKSGEDAVVTGVAGVLGSPATITATLSFADNSYGYAGNTTATALITVIGNSPLSPTWYNFSAQIGPVNPQANLIWSLDPNTQPGGHIEIFMYNAQDTLCSEHINNFDVSTMPQGGKYLFSNKLGAEYRFMLVDKATGGKSGVSACIDVKLTSWYELSAQTDSVEPKATLTWTRDSNTVRAGGLLLQMYGAKDTQCSKTVLSSTDISKYPDQGNHIFDGTSGAEYRFMLVDKATGGKSGVSACIDVKLTVVISHVATVSSQIYTVSAGGTSNETITDVPYSTSRGTFEANLSPDNKYETRDDSVIGHISNPVQTGDTLVVTAQDGTTTVTYTVTVLPPSDVATVTSSIYGVFDCSIVMSGSCEGQTAGTIFNVPYGTSKATFESALTMRDPNETWDDSVIGHISNPVQTGDTLVVTAQDGVTQVTYTVTVVVPIFYTVTYDGNGSDIGVGSIPTDGSAYGQGTIVKVLGNIGGLTNGSYDFAGWNTAADGSGIYYFGGSAFVMGTADVTLYAQWATYPLYSIGNTDPATGGLIFYVNSNHAIDGWEYMEAAPNDQSSGIDWSNIQDELVGTTGTAIGTGQANTVAIIAQTEGATTCTEGAAYLCSQQTIGGYSDWFFPSKDELNQIYVNLAANGVGGFTGLWYYWSSSEYDGGDAWLQLFNGANPSGAQYSGGKGYGNGWNVRCVRAF